VKTLLEEDRRITVDQVALEIGVSHASAYAIIVEELGKVKKCARWVPHVLTDDEKVARLAICHAHLRRFKREGDAFLSRIIAGDECWMRSYEPELKRQSAEWCAPDSPRPKKARREASNLKSLHIVFYSSKKVLVDYAVQPGETVNAELYRWVLIHKLRPAISRKQGDLLESGPILLHDNASPHRAVSVVEQLATWQWEILPHPAYSPDISPCDFHLFTKLKEPLRGTRFLTLLMTLAQSFPLN
jgi:histone-lysine N-methyltransferase SETMAR